MFTWRHILWLIICAACIMAALKYYQKKKPSLITILSTAFLLSLLSEITKIMNVIKMIPSENGIIYLPYLQLNHMPLHFCSIQLILIAYVRFTHDENKRKRVLTFMAPTCMLGGTIAMLMPSIFSTTISIGQAFTSPVSYQFFLFHSTLVWLGLVIVSSGEITWTWKGYINTLMILYLMGVISIYINSLLASPHYVDGNLVSVDFWTNFFFTYQNPLGIKLVYLWQWQIYLVIISALTALLLFLFYLAVMKNSQAHQTDL